MTKLHSGIKVKRVHKKRECSTTLEQKCACCDELPVVKVTLVRFMLQVDKKNKNDGKIIFELCQRHLDELKEIIKYF